VRLPVVEGRGLVVKRVGGWGWSRLLLLQIINLCILLGIRLLLLRRFRGHVMAHTIGCSSYHSGS